MTRFDAAVVGAGPVGLTAALLLARVALVEAATAPGDLPRAISIADETFRIMDRLGVADELKAEAHLDTGARYYGLNDRLLAATKPAPSRTGHPAKSQFDQPVMEELLWRLAVEEPGIEFLTGTRATGIAQDPSGVVLRVRAEASGEEGEIRADRLVGADGGRSFTRDALGITLEGSTQQERWIVIDLLNVPGDVEPYAEFHGDGKRPYVFVPGIKGRLRLEYMLFDGEDADEMTRMDRILDLSRRFHPGIVPEDVRRATVYVAHQRVAETYRRGNAFLIGDAAHLMPPFSGQGLNAGLRDAANLAWKLLDVRRGVGTDALLDTYETERRTHGAKMVRVSQRTGAVVMAVGTWKPRLRDAAFRALRLIRPVHRYLASMRFITPPDYRDGAAVEPASGVDARLRAMVGLALSQPEVALPGGGNEMLDRLLGDGWALIELGGGAEAARVSPFWLGIGASMIRLAAPGEPAGDRLVDPSGLLAQGGFSEPHFLLVRPDRYVAAAFTAASEAETIRALSTYLTVPGAAR